VRGLEFKVLERQVAAIQEQRLRRACQSRNSAFGILYMYTCDIYVYMCTYPYSGDILYQYTCAHKYTARGRSADFRESPPDERSVGGAPAG